MQAPFKGDVLLVVLHGCQGLDLPFGALFGGLWPIWGYGLVSTLGLKLGGGDQP